MFNRIKNIIELSRFKPSAENRTIPDGARLTMLVEDIPLGDGKAEFIGEGTEAEFLEQEQEDKGNKSWLDRLKRL